MSADDTSIDRRSVLETAGVAVGGVFGAAVTTGPVAADCTETYSGNGDSTVYDDCGSDPIGTVPESERGCIVDSCEGFEETYYYVEWDSASPDGWVAESDLLVRQEA